MGKKITRDEFDDLLRKGRPWIETESELWSRIQEAQSSEPMSRAEVLSALDSALGDDIHIFTGRQLDAIRALTVQQGFVPDWSNAPKDAVGVAIIWNGIGYGCARYSQIETDTNSALIEFIPRPATKMRQKTGAELCQEYVNFAYSESGLSELSTWSALAINMANGKTIHDLCRAAGIPLETTE